MGCSSRRFLLFVDSSIPVCEDVCLLELQQGLGQLWDLDAKEACSSFGMWSILAATKADLMG